ncbi:MAG: alkaline phosphatase [Verrucomicrobiales bacterium]|jgi:alkaline phosphatase|nr:alkaline phosphatase [Verrucomicrobiales bacterium]MBP9224082.1 alkaline phosphatase [Verrucomicrobiales bacterium]HQZ28241.1 alkaline phosphatase [Verrucomicrobiales bacterium]
MNSSTTSRRNFLSASFATSAVFGAESSLLADDTRKAAANDGQARNVIFMVSDGMNLGAPSLAKLFRQRSGGTEPHWTKSYRERPVVRALVETYSASSCVTDSAAAASAWGIGERITNGMLNILPDGRPLPTLHEKLQKVGKRTGLVTTATITHATPAGFAATSKDRGKEPDIAEQYLDRKVDVLLGGGIKNFSDDLRKKYSSAGYGFVGDRKALQKVGGEAGTPLLGLFSDGHMPFELDRLNDPKLDLSVPRLAEMTGAALRQLDGSPEGFFLLVEGARIDHAGHANDAAASIHDQLAFDDAIGVALDYIDKHPDTLLVITTDHGCGGIQMNGVKGNPDEQFGPGSYAGSNSYFDRLQGFRHSFEWMKADGVAALSGPKLAAAFEKYTGLKLTEDQTKLAQGLKDRVGAVVFEHTGVGWTSQNHTGELVEFCAFGPGSKRFPAFMQNREVHGILLDILDVKKVPA